MARRPSDGRATSEDPVGAVPDSWACRLPRLLVCGRDHEVVVLCPVAGPRDVLRERALRLVGFFACAGPGRSWRRAASAVVALMQGTVGVSGCGIGCGHVSGKHPSDRGGAPTACPPGADGPKLRPQSTAGDPMTCAVTDSQSRARRTSAHRAKDGPHPRRLGAACRRGERRPARADDDACRRWPGPPLARHGWRVQARRGRRRRLGTPLLTTCPCRARMSLGSGLTGTAAAQWVANGEQPVPGDLGPLGE